MQITISHITQNTHVENSQINHWSATSPLVVIAGVLVIVITALLLLRAYRNKEQR